MQVYSERFCFKLYSDNDFHLYTFIDYFLKMKKIEFFACGLHDVILYEPVFRTIY